jgi:vancomycin resistance protein YoaR
VIAESPWPTGWDQWRPPAEWAPLPLPEDWHAAGGRGEASPPPRSEEEAASDPGDRRRGGRGPRTGVVSGSRCQTPVSDAGWLTPSAAGRAAAGTVARLWPLSVEAPFTAARMRRRGRPARGRVVARTLSLATVVAALVVAVLGLAFAGSPAKLAEGVHIAGVDVSGLKPEDAQRMLERRADRLSRVPVTFVADDRRWRITPSQLGVEVDWAAAVEAARRQGEGFGPVRGFKRLQVRFFGADVAPATQVFDNALRYEVGRLATAIARRPREAAIERRGLDAVVVPAASGRELDRAAAERVLVRALAAFARAPVGLPVRHDPPRVTAAELAPALADARLALSAPIRVAFGETRWRLPRWRIAELLLLPRRGGTKLRIGGPGAERWFERLAARVNRPAQDAGFAVDGTTVSVVASREGYAIDVPRTADALLSAAVSPTSRVASLAIATTKPERSTADARAMGIASQVAAYTTTYGGEPNRLHNVRLVAELIDDTLIAPGTTFSFNQTTGERTADKGFLEAPVIINGELQTGLGGGVCQVSTTVFNAAYEAGLPIESRTNHALYISHYPLGRDATVNYPDLDLRFRNDTGHWLLLRTWVGSSSLTVALYGSPVDRRVESETAPLVAVAGPRLQRIPDPTLDKGETALEDSGEPARRTSVRRRVYDAEGKLLYDTTWSSYYRSEPRVIRVGTKPLPKPKAKPKPKKGQAAKPKPQPAPPGGPTDPAAAELVPPAPPDGAIIEPPPGE